MKVQRTWQRLGITLLLLTCCILVLLFGYFAFQRSPAQNVHPTATSTQTHPGTTPLIIRPPLFAVNNVVWSPDGRRIALANRDGIFQVWDAATGQLVSTHYDDRRFMPVTILAWTSDSKRVISTAFAQGATTQVWDATSGKTLVTFSSFFPVAASYDGKHIAVGSGGSVQVWDTLTGTKILAFDTTTSRVEHIVWSPDDRFLATTNVMAGGTSDYTAQVWDATTGTHLSTYHSPSGNDIFPLAWAPDSQHLVSTSGYNPVIEQTWNAASGKPLLSFHGTTQQPEYLAWSPDGTHIASAGQIWDAVTGNLSFTVGGQSVAWSPDGKQIAVVGTGLKMQVWNTATGQPTMTYHDAADQSQVTWSPDGRSLASVDQAGTSVWEANADHRITTIAAHHQVENAVTWSPDGTRIAAEDGARLYTGFWDAATGENLGDLTLYHEDLTLRNYRNATTIAWSPDGAHVADAWSPRFIFDSRSPQVNVWGNQVVQCGLSEDCPFPGGSHADLITSVAWSPDSKFIASASLDKTVVIYDVAQQKNLVTYRGHTAGVTAVAWSPDGKYIASASADKTIQIWDPTTGKTVFTFRGHTDAVTSVAWSHDSTRIVSGSLDGTVRIWDAVHHTLILTYHGHTGTVTTVAWSPDGKSVASGSADKTIQIWDPTTGKAVFTFRGHTDAVTSVAWSPNGRRIASSGKDGTIQIWQPST